ncbi:MAG: fliO, partial [Modestobacter sp.]|nr:fliO [Modestobacter sp.]
MTWMLVRLVLSLAFIAAVLLFASRLAKKRGLGQGNGLIEVVARQRMGRASSVSVLRVAGRVLVIGSTDEQVTLLAEMEESEVQTALAAAPRAVPAGGDGAPGATPAPR